VQHGDRSIAVATLERGQLGERRACFARGVPLPGHPLPLGQDPCVRVADDLGEEYEQHRVQRERRDAVAPGDERDREQVEHRRQVSVLAPGVGVVEQEEQREMGEEDRARAERETIAAPRAERETIAAPRAERETIAAPRPGRGTATAP